METVVMPDSNNRKPDQTAKNPDNLSAEDVRQGRIVLYNRKQKLIFFGGLALLVVVILALRFSG